MLEEASGSPKPQHALSAHIPHHSSLVVRFTRDVSQEQREEALKATEYNVFSFPAALLGLLSFMATKPMGATKASSNNYVYLAGYYLLLDAIRDTFERGDKPHRAIKLVLTGEEDVDLLMKELYLTEYSGGFVNGGTQQLIRPNAFLVPQGRCAEYLLFSTVAEVLMEQWGEQSKGGSEVPPKWLIPSNGHFDTTAANIYATKVILPMNLFDGDVLAEFDGDVEKDNPFKGNMNVERLREFLILHKGRVPLVFLTITNNTACGQPVSLANMKAVKQIADEFDIPLFFDACRFAENAYFVQQFEEGQKHRSLSSIVQECFSYADGFTISFKKDGMANIGGGLFFRDGGKFQQKFSRNGDINGPENIGVRLKEKQILTFGNDSYGALSGRDILSIAVGLYEVVKPTYLSERIGLTQEFAVKLHNAGIPVVMPPGGHAVYLDMNRFFSGLKDDDGNEAMKLEDFGGVGLTIELIRRYGIRACELGPFAFEWDQKGEDEKKGVLNVVRLAIPRNAYSSEHIDYTVQALKELHKHRDHIPKVRIARGATLRLRHFQSGLEPIYPHKITKRE